MKRAIGDVRDWNVGDLDRAIEDVLDARRQCRQIRRERDQCRHELAQCKETNRQLRGRVAKLNVDWDKRFAKLNVKWEKWAEEQVGKAASQLEALRVKLEQKVAYLTSINQGQRDNITNLRLQLQLPGSIRNR